MHSSQSLTASIVHAMAGEGGGFPNAFPRTIGPNAMKYLAEVVDSGLTVDMVGRFEKAFSDALGMKYCIATPGCTSALHVLALAAQFEPGDEIVVSPITDYGTLQGLLAQQLIPIFADAAPNAINFSAETIAPCITARTRAILCVHKTGIINDMDPINALAKKHGILVFEDACQAVFGEYKGRLAGTLGDAACFSFDPEKTMGSDTGGCMVTNDPALHEQARYMGQLRAGEMRPHFGRTHTHVGYAQRMSQCTAAMSLAQLEIVREQVRQRDAMARLLYKLLGEIPGIRPLHVPEYVNVYSCWMIGFNIEPDAFTCDAETFAATLSDAGVTGAGPAQYYVMTDALTFLHRWTAEKRYPFSTPPASRIPTYGEADCPTARAFMKTFVRWVTFSDRYQPEHCELAARLVTHVADQYRS